MGERLAARTQQRHHRVRARGAAAAPVGGLHPDVADFRELHGVEVAVGGGVEAADTARSELKEVLEKRLANYELRFRDDNPAWKWSSRIDAAGDFLREVNHR